MATQRFRDEAAEVRNKQGTSRTNKEQIGTAVPQLWQDVSASSIPFHLFTFQNLANTSSLHGKHASVHLLRLFITRHYQNHV